MFLKSIGKGSYEHKGRWIIIGRLKDFTDVVSGAELFSYKVYLAVLERICGTHSPYAYSVPVI
jgi:hypothetical protein